MFPEKVKQALIEVVGEGWVKDDAVTRYTYRCDGLTLHPSEPMGVVWPATTDEVSAVVRILAGEGITFLPRGAGTGLSGGAVPEAGAVLIEMCRFNQVHHIDPLNRLIRVGPGVVNIAVSQSAGPHHLRFAPDPSSQKACSVGGNVGENAGGPHTLKYGVTVNHILGLEVVLPDGEIVRLGGEHWGDAGPDLLGLFIGSEGTFGIVTEVTCRLVPTPERAVTLLAVYGDAGDASRSVAAMIRSGIVPAALELIDAVVIRAVEATFQAGFPTDAAAVLIIELEDLHEGLDDEAAAIEAMCLREGAREVRRAKSESERAIIWRARKEALGAIGSISPSFYTQDGVIPRSKLPEVLTAIEEIGKRYNLLIANVFHAGDGNIHPLILYNSQDEAEIAAVHQAGREILQFCIDAGGVLSGEHGVGLEKADMMDQLFASADLDEMKRVRAVFNPRELLNPGKIFPQPGRCSEMKMVRAKTGVIV